MKRLLPIVLAFTSFVHAQEQKNVTLLDHWHEDTLVTNTLSVRYSGCWGFVFEGNEYAIIGSTEGNHFFQLTSDNKLKNAGFVEGKYNSSQVVHREFKTYSHYAYAICDEGNSSLQIIDLNYLPDSVVKVADIQDANFGKVHNLFIDTTNALLYACLVTPIVAGNPLAKVPLRVFSLSDPINPVLLWEGPSDIPEVHDCYVRNNMAIMNCGQDGLRVYDFTNPSSPSYINNLTFYQDQGYNHQGWLSPDGKTYVFADETSGKRVKKCSVDQNFNIQVTGLFGAAYNDGSIPHNIMCTNDLAFVAYYNQGLRIFDLKNSLVEVGAYDTYTSSSQFQMNGAWGVYSEYPSERIVISDRQNGLFLFDFDRSIFEIGAGNEFSFYPNPVSQAESLTIRSPKDEISSFSVAVYNATGEIVLEKNAENESYLKIAPLNVPGIYAIRILYTNYLEELTSETYKIIVQ